MHRPHLVAALFAMFAPFVISGCGKPAPEPKANHVTWESCVRELADLSALPVIDGRTVRLHSSYDRTGGNNDFNYFANRSQDAGWVVLADLKGPGVIRRLWMTGTDPGHGIRIFIDGEKTPRIDTDLDSLFGITAPWTAPLAQYVNMCYYSYLPVTFNESVRIETQEPNVHPFWGPRRLFFQFGVEYFDPETTSVESYPASFTPAQLAAAATVAAQWTGAIEDRDSGPVPDAPVVTIAAGSSAAVFEADGAGTLTEWHINVRPADDSGWTQMDREYLLQDTVLKVYYDQSATPSMVAPLGDFFANGWRKRTYGAWWMSSTEQGFTCRLPIPFRNGVRVEIENGADRDIEAIWSAERSGTVADGAGYLHAEYRRSGPTGPQNHLVTRINGRGKFLGCFLGVTGLDPSWWILEGDERMLVDGQAQPVWHGTGLEDYFNGGWYYRGSVFGALNANFDRSPFRVAQFRHQHADPVSFDRSFQMEFERMRHEQNGQPVQGYFQSVAYFYLDSPAVVANLPDARDERRAMANPNDRPTFMLQLVELERGNDFHSAIRYIDEYRERYPGSEEDGVLLLRQLEYRRLIGSGIGPDDYTPFLEGAHGEEAQKQARQLEWFYAASNRVLVGMNVNGRGRLLLDNKPLMAGDHPYYLYVMEAELEPGLHRLAAQVEFQRAEPWLQVGLRTHDGVAGTGPGTWSTREQVAGWSTAEPSAPAWYNIGLRDVPRGVPDAPYIGGIPNAFILLQSKSYPVRGLDWGYHRGTMFFRQDVSVPVSGWPGFSGIMTGLSR